MLEQLSIVELSKEFATAKQLLESKEAEFKKWKSAMESRLDSLAQTIMKHMEDTNQKTLPTAQGTFGTQVKGRASSTSTAEFTTWLEQNPTRLQYATIKPRQDAIKKFVTETGDTPPGISYEQIKEITFRRA
jgi:hypothetical protein